ncbi:MAG: hypothetical protein IJI65_09320 [Lachnospiraceae bacterium]|nr:hypothetical protein [Lachnospiraceae bacterium]
MVKNKIGKEKALSVLKDVIEQKLKGYLPDEYKDAKISFSEVTKNNDEKKTALLIQLPDEKVTPTIYLDSFVDMYEDPLTSEDEILSTISDVYVKNVEGGRSFEKGIIDRISGGFDGVKDMIIMSVVNTKMNAEVLKDTPHRDVEDLSIIYKLYLERVDDRSMGTIKISDQLMEQWGVTEQDLYDTAMKNTKELLPTRIDSMQSILSEFMGPDAGFDMEKEMYVITNERKTNGATAVFCDREKLDELCDKLHGSVLLIPSSIHEFLVLPAGEEGGVSPSVREIADMIKEVNVSTVPPEEILGTEPYHYDKENGFELAEKYEARIKGISNLEETEVKNMTFVMKDPTGDGSVESKDEEPEVAVPSGLHM